MKNYMKSLTSIAALIGSMFLHTPAFAATLQCPTANQNIVAMGGDSFTTGTTGLVTITGGHNIESALVQGCTTVGLPGVAIGASGTAGTLTIYPATAAYGTLAVTTSGNSGNYAEIINAASIGQASTITLPDPGSATASLLLTKGNQSISGINTFTVGLLDTAATNQLTLGAASHTTVLNSTAPAAATQTINVPDSGVASDTVALLGLAQTFTGVNTYGAASSIVSKSATGTTDIAPPFDNRLLGNPVMKLAYGTCSIASINAKTCVILTGVATRKISVEYFDVVSAGTPATCTGVLLEDNNGTPVVVSTMNVAQLGSGVHDIPLTAALGVGFGAGTGLTSGAGLQLDVNGSSCTTATAMTYAITYTVQ